MADHIVQGRYHLRASARTLLQSNNDAYSMGGIPNALKFTMHKILPLLIVLIANTAKSEPFVFKDGIFPMSNTDFYVGDLQRSYSAETPNRFNFKHGSWLQDILDRDTVLHGHFANFRETVGFTATEQLTLNQHKLNPTADPDFVVAGSIVHKLGPRAYDIVSQDPELPFYAHCAVIYIESERFRPEDISTCYMSVPYPYDTHVILQARRFFPGISIAEYGPMFEAVARRLVEIATCLDVTNRQIFDPTAHMDQVLIDHPDFKDCKISNFPNS